MTGKTDLHRLVTDASCSATHFLCIELIRLLHVDPEHPKRAQRVTCLVSMQAMEEMGNFQLPEIDPCDMGLCIMLKHEVMAADEWHNNGPQDLITVSLCIQITIKMQLCSLPVVYACPYHNPTANKR